MPVVFGKHGLAWAKGLQPFVPPNVQMRCEGSLTSPKGIFSIDALFGFDPFIAEHYPKMQTLYFHENLVGVDDVHSKFYNQIVDVQKVEKDWTSYEDLSQISVYKMGATIGFNTLEKDRLAGSLVFLHLWRSPTSPTAGCTALCEKNLEALMEWLDEKKHPVIIQLTQKDYQDYKDLWQLP